MAPFISVFWCTRCLSYLFPRNGQRPTTLWCLAPSEFIFWFTCCAFVITVSQEWNETHYLLVHDPTREHMKVEVYDHDAISPMDILKLNFKEVLDAKELLGRCLVNVKPITSNIDKTSKRRLPYEYWYDLGKGEWDKVGGCGRGRGRLQLSCLYRPFSDIPPLNPATGVSGILIFKIVQAHRLPRAVRMGLKMSVNAEVRCGKQRQIVSTVTSEGDHKWNNLNTLDFHGIKCVPWLGLPFLAPVARCMV
ncbi:hypothetical protein DUNSADRAFT_2082 [Dunaliella salina]|uniref:C2 domain-containing protein n=1 Tax=Dunaliella salina TaxID=3046 RepID=A0ABQ7FWP7_DUNSA|nr:hypothetical protein DUNSADRAFT_2082 [Dunaliella salina]|eukprot:KAF5826768.1 hypothetical protein DUNSADRAFT_2082 [Dunaliella salina]